MSSRLSITQKTDESLTINSNSVSSDSILDAICRDGLPRPKHEHTEDVSSASHREYRKTLLKHTHPTGKFVYRNGDKQLKNRLSRRNMIAKIEADLNAFMRTGDMVPQKLHDPTLDVLWNEVTSKLPPSETAVEAADYRAGNSFLYRKYLSLLPNECRPQRCRKNPIKVMEERVTQIPAASSLGNNTLDKWMSEVYGCEKLIEEELDEEQLHEEKLKVDKDNSAQYREGTEEKLNSHKTRPFVTNYSKYSGKRGNPPVQGKYIHLSDVHLRGKKAPIIQAKSKVKTMMKLNGIFNKSLVSEQEKKEKRWYEA